MEDKVIGMSEYHWYCNKCERSHYKGEMCPSVKKEVSR